MQKSVFRRAKACISLKQFALALNDMAYLCRMDKKDATDWLHYEAHYREVGEIVFSCNIGGLLFL